MQFKMGFGAGDGIRTSDLLCLALNKSAKVTMLVGAHIIRELQITNKKV
ncbi:MAG: hypothetical protein M1561_01500 [Gammaproteobacteria bacterium]|nr:hypothetical protein [Gammaproteobacteria bacterium]